MQRRADRVGAPAKAKPKTAARRRDHGLEPDARVLVAGRGRDRGRGGRRGDRHPASGAGLRPVVGAAASPSPGASSNASPGSSAAGTCPTSQPPPCRPARRRTVTLDTPKGTMVIKVEADLSPIAAGNFVALASCGYLRRDAVPSDGRAPGRHAVRHPGRPEWRTGPGYTIQDEQVTSHVQARHGRDGPVLRAELAWARSSSSCSTTRTATCWPGTTPTRSSATSPPGMETADAIFAASGGVEQPAEPDPDHDRDCRQPMSPATERGVRP